ncbi:phosphonoacetaldehyde hydrolase [Metabacillus herbersteinensis]|uniref:Phosphonoacetaldehyde hydrolase n=1 Tax=Metabacillus herbersteinensis TaxID=283816 RepID=A0ABV6GNX9_9BACI
MNKYEGIILDWAGTAIDYGCFAPLKVFIEIFTNKGVNITTEEARVPMGLPKIDHVRAICEMPRVKESWLQIHGETPSEKNIQEMYEQFEEILFEVLPEYTTPIPGVLETVQILRDKGYKIGSTTGYTREMMNIVVPAAKEKGYSPDFIVTPDEVKEGRPYPWMCYLNAMELGIYPMNKLLKVGDTTSDMKEGRNAGMYTVGVILGSSELGLAEHEMNELPKDLLLEKKSAVKERFLAAGANEVIDSFSDLPNLLEKFEKQPMVISK